jgi:hypothetical protein
MSDALTLELSARDAQWIAAALAVCSTLLGDYEDDFENNCNALLMLFERDYSAAEVNALNFRSRALLPFDSPICITDDGPFLASASTLVS